MKPESLSVLTIHAEVEGCLALVCFGSSSSSFGSEGETGALGQLLPPADQIPGAVIGRQKVEGREGWLSVQQEMAEKGDMRRMRFQCHQGES
jgi:hypothetical protein